MKRWTILLIAFMALVVLLASLPGSTPCWLKGIDTIGSE